jgi:ribosomal protein L37AE/L43A
MVAKKFCPKCENTDVYMDAGGVTGIWSCKKCGFSSSIFPEKEESVTKPKKKK